MDVDHNKITTQLRDIPTSKCARATVLAESMMHHFAKAVVADFVDAGRREQLEALDVWRNHTEVPLLVADGTVAFADLPLGAVGGEVDFILDLTAMA